MQRKVSPASFLRSYSFSPNMRFPVKAAQNMARKRPRSRPTHQSRDDGKKFAVIRLHGHNTNGQKDENDRKTDYVSFCRHEALFEPRWTYRTKSAQEQVQKRRTTSRKRFAPCVIKAID